MDKITVKLLGTPEVYYNGQQMSFPFRKAEALFYYLLVHSHGSRDELVNLLWAEVEENTGKKNLRNAVYMIRKMFGLTVIISPQRANLQLNGDIEWDVDLAKFFDGQNIQDLKTYTGDFLQGFFVKDAENFENWMVQYRENLRGKYINKLHRAIQQCIERKSYDEAEQYCKRLIQWDEFDEGAYRTLMKIYKIKGRYNKGIEIYHKLVEILNKEMAISPDLKSIEMFEELLREKSLEEMAKKEEHREFYYGREMELEILSKNHHAFLSKELGKSMMIIGEPGIGKSRLVEKFLTKIDLQQVYLLTAYCYKAEEHYLLKPWNGIFSKLSQYMEQENLTIPLLWQNIISCIFPVFTGNHHPVEINPIEKIDILKYQVAENAIISVLHKIAKNKKVILFFEDIQWMDAMSLSLLKNVMLESEDHPIMVLTTARDGYENKTEQFITEMIHYNRLEKIILQRFNREEVADFAGKMVPHLTFTEGLTETLFQETEGNAFFLVEFLNSLDQNGSFGAISPKMKDVLKSRILNISQEGQKILNIVSIFFDKVSFGNLQQLSGKCELELMDLLEELQHKCLLKEVGGEKDIKFTFTHQKLRQYIYEQLSLSRKRILHLRIGSLLEGNLKNDKTDSLQYSKLVYHFFHGGNKLKALKYRIKNMEEYLHFSHEIFPVLGDTGMFEKGYFYLNETQAQEQLKELGVLLDEVWREEGSSDEWQSLHVSYLHMMGRFFIRQGEYEQGLGMIETVIQRAQEMRAYELALKGYRQMIYYCINIQNGEKIGWFAQKALDIAQKSGQVGESAILLRLKGFGKIMEGAYEEGESLLKNAITIFQTLNQQRAYSLNIAASYNFLGESKRANCKFVEAMDYYQRAISICEENKLVRGLAIFCTNAGQAAFDMGEDEKASFYFNKALNLYDQLDSLWGRSTARGYAALLMIKRGSYEEGLKYLMMAEEDACQLKSPYEIGLIWRVKAEMRASMDKDRKLKKVLNNYLTKDVAQYCHGAIDILKNVKGCYEVDRLKDLLRSCK